MSCVWPAGYAFVRLLVEPPDLGLDRPDPVDDALPDPARVRVVVPALRATVARAASFPLGAPMGPRLGMTSDRHAEAATPSSGVVRRELGRRGGPYRRVFTIVSESGPDSTTTKPSDR